MSWSILALILFALSGLQTVVLVTYMFRVAGGLPPGPDAARGSGRIPDLEEMKRHIVWKSFYVNPDDPRGWAPKTFGVGWTVNFRTRRRAAIFAAMIFSTSALALGGATILLLCAG